MAGMGWAAVPLYDLFCRVTGYGGTTQVGAASERVLDQTIRIRFDASKARDMPWEFRPVERTMEIRLGETGIAFYEAYNPTDEPVAGTASYNVTPYDAGSTSPRSTASASSTRCCSRASGSRCR
jgi:cytochrome c oxidase assembly protein subunit 11